MHEPVEYAHAGHDGTSFNAVTWLLDRNVELGRGDKIAFIDSTNKVSYRELQANSCRVASLLTRLGVRQEERVAIIAIDTVEFPAIFLGTMRAGAIPVPLNTLLTPDQYQYVLDDSRAKVLFISEALYNPIRDVLTQVQTLSEIVVIGGSSTGCHRSYAQEIADVPTVFVTVRTHRDEPAFWLYSSGSTGRPKGTRHVHSSLAATAETYGAKVLGITENDTVLSAAKFYFAYGLGNAMTFPMSVGATTILNEERATPERIFDLIRLHRPTLFFGVPTLVASMLASQAMNSSDLASLRLCVSAGEALPKAVGDEWTRCCGVEILDGVGSTELLHIFLSNRPGDVAYGTCGVPVPGYEVRLVDETGADVPQGELGELLVSGPSAAEGYWNQREKTRYTFLGEWTRTGDKYYREPSGRHVFCGRADDMFKVSGIWVSPAEVESALVSHPAVLEAAVIPKPDIDGLLKLKAFIVLAPNVAPTGLERALKNHVKATVGPWKYSRWIEIVDEFPKTATGKIQRFKLREQSQ